jgi:imidazolonepropionase-like amidohydrolase
MRDDKLKERLFAAIIFCSLAGRPLLAPAQDDAATASAEGKARKVTALVNVNVIPMDRQRVLKGQTVVVRDGKVAELGEAAKIKTVGTIERGKRADLVLLTANPLDDIANTEKRAGVMARGRWLPQPELQKQLDEIALRFQNQ